MTTKKQHTNQLINKLADYIFANPTEKRGKLLDKFGSEWQISPRTFDRLWKQAKDYNNTRITTQRSAVDAEVTAAVEHIRQCIVNREDIMRRLADIAYRSDSESNSVRAIDLIAKIEGWYAPIKSMTADVTNMPAMQPLSPEEIKKVVAELESFC